MVCPKAAYQGRQANAYKHGNDKNTFFHPYSPYSGYHFTGKNAILSIKETKEASEMEQIKVGRFITKKRKEQNLTQEQLAERLGISNKTISKWETGVSHS